MLGLRPRWLHFTLLAVYFHCAHQVPSVGYRPSIISLNFENDRHRILYVLYDSKSPFSSDIIDLIRPGGWGWVYLQTSLKFRKERKIVKTRKNLEQSRITCFIRLLISYFFGFFSTIIDIFHFWYSYLMILFLDLTLIIIFEFW